MRSELFNRNNSPKVENVNGLCQEKEDEYFRASKKFLKEFEGLVFLKSTQNTKKEEEFRSSVRPLVKEIGDLIFGIDCSDKNQQGFRLNTLNFEKLNILLNTIKPLIYKYKIPTNKSEMTDYHYFYLDIDVLEELVFLNGIVERKLQLPPNTLEFAENIYEEDLDPYFEKGIPQFNAYTKTKKYPTSLMFPEVLEKEEELLHIKSLCTRFGLNLSKAYKAISNPSSATLEEKYALSNVMRILNDPQYKYRPFRKANVFQKPISIEELFLTAGI